MSSGLFKWMIVALFGFRTVALIAGIAALLCLLR